MSQQTGAGCERPTLSVKQPPNDDAQSKNEPPVEEKAMVRIGQKAPDFTAPALINDEFGQITLSEYLGQWVVLCFYPGDFTFV